MKRYSLLSAMVALFATATTALAQPDTLWTKTFGSWGHDFCYSVEQTNDGGYILGGFTAYTPESSYYMYLVKTGSQGNLQWQQIYGIAYWRSICYSIQQTADGGFILGGYNEVATYPIERMYLVKTDHQGNFQWQETCGE
ncbi:MAG: hypothetical protein ABH878_10565, partial [bacterium]